MKADIFSSEDWSYYWVFVDSRYRGAVRLRWSFDDEKMSAEMRRAAREINELVVGCDRDTLWEASYSIGEAFDDDRSISPEQLAEGLVEGRTRLFSEYKDGMPGRFYVWCWAMGQAMDAYSLADSRGTTWIQRMTVRAQGGGYNNAAVGRMEQRMWRLLGDDPLTSAVKRQLAVQVEKSLAVQRPAHTKRQASLPGVAWCHVARADHRQRHAVQRTDLCVVEWDVGTATYRAHVHWDGSNFRTEDGKLVCYRFLERQDAANRIGWRDGAARAWFRAGIDRKSGTLVTLYWDGAVFMDAQSNVYIWTRICSLDKAGRVQWVNEDRRLAFYRQYYQVQ